jgi:hypothetical protein
VGTVAEVESSSGDCGSGGGQQCDRWLRYRAAVGTVAEVEAALGTVAEVEGSSGDGGCGRVSSSGDGR